MPVNGKKIPSASGTASICLKRPSVHDLKASLDKALLSRQYFKWPCLNLPRIRDSPSVFNANYFATLTGRRGSVGQRGAIYRQTPKGRANINTNTNRWWVQHTMNANANASAVHTHLYILLMNCRRTLIKQRQPQRHTTDMHRYIELYIYIYKQMYVYVWNCTIYLAKLCRVGILRRVHCYLICAIHLHSSGFTSTSSSSPGIVYGHNEDSLLL